MKAKVLMIITALIVGVIAQYTIADINQILNQERVFRVRARRNERDFNNLFNPD